MSMTSTTRPSGLDRHHVGAGHHHLADDGVAEVDDRVDEGALLALDHVLLGRLSAMASSISSDVYGPSLMPLPGRSQLDDRSEPG